MTAAVAEHHSTGTVAIQQRFAQLVASGVLLRFACLRVAQDGQQRLAVAVIGYRRDVATGARVVRQCLQGVDGAGHFGVVALFGFEALKIVVALAIQQPQAGKVALDTHLFGGRGEQQQAGNHRRKLFNAPIAGAAAFFTPVEVVRFVNNQQVELAGQCLLLTLRVGK